MFTIRQCINKLREVERSHGNIPMKFSIEGVSYLYVDEEIIEEEDYDDSEVLVFNLVKEDGKV